MSLAAARAWWRVRRWPRCSCGAMRVAPGTRTELAGVSHGHTPCFHCDPYGRPT